jgi:hypothetical protein
VTVTVSSTCNTHDRQNGCCFVLIELAGARHASAGPCGAHTIVLQAAPCAAKNVPLEGSLRHNDRTGSVTPPAPSQPQGCRGTPDHKRPVVLAQIVLPLLCFDEEDALLWEEDPQEFVRKVRLQSNVQGQMSCPAMQQYRIVAALQQAS